MADSELRIAGIGISKEVVSAIVSRAAGSVAGVASVGGNDTIASNLINVFTNKSIAPSQAVESVVEKIDGKGENPKLTFYTYERI